MIGYLKMSERKWMFDMSMKCPYCGKHELFFSEPTCPESSNILNKEYFIILKLREFDKRIKELENDGIKEGTTEDKLGD